MFTCYENGHKCQYPECKVDPSWDNASFETLDKAVSYLHKWMGIYSPGIETLKKKMGFDYCWGMEFEEVTNFKIIEH